MWYKGTIGFYSGKKKNRTVKFSGKIFGTRNILSDVTPSQKNVTCKLSYVDPSFEFLDLSLTWSVCRGQEGKQNTNTKTKTGS